MISSGQLQNRRATVTRGLKEAFPSTIQFAEDGAHTDIAVTRWSLKSGAVADGVAGLLQTLDVAFRIETALIPAGIKIVEKRTVVIEAGISYRVETIASAPNDPGIVLNCKQP